MNSAPLNHFDRIAPVYDTLARLVFGHSMVKSQTHYLRYLAKDSKILMLGGGSGWLLAELVRQYPLSQVWYIEASKKMISLARERNFNQSNVRFIHGTEEMIPNNQIFDIIITNFYLDMFTENMQEQIIQKIISRLNPKGSWLVTDFVNDGKIWQRVMLKIMYTFFRIVCRIQAADLADWRKQISCSGFTAIESTSFYYGFITSILYKSNK